MRAIWWAIRYFADLLTWLTVALSSDKLFGFFVRQVMKAMAGKGNPALVNEALRRRLS